MFENDLYWLSVALFAVWRKGVTVKGMWKLEIWSKKILWTRLRPVMKGRLLPAPSQRFRHRVVAGDALTG